MVYEMLDIRSYLAYNRASAGKSNIADDRLLAVLVATLFNNLVTLNAVRRCRHSVQSRRDQRRYRLRNGVTAESHQPVHALSCSKRSVAGRKVNRNRKVESTPQRIRNTPCVSFGGKSPSTVIHETPHGGGGG